MMVQNNLSSGFIFTFYFGIIIKYGTIENDKKTNENKSITDQDQA
jgi:hypothetical protein